MGSKSCRDCVVSGLPLEPEPTTSCTRLSSRPHRPRNTRRHHRGHALILGGWIVYRRSELGSQLPIPIVCFSFASVGAMEFATIGGAKLTTIWRAKAAKMADSCEGEGESFFSVNACYCYQCDNVVFAVLNGCIVFRWQGVGR